MLIIPKPVRTGESPEKVAFRLSHLDGFVFFDSSDAGSGSGGTEEGGRLSIVTALPRRIWKGRLGEGTDLERILRQRKSCVADWGMPNGGFLGYVNFDGSYVFGEYDHLLVFQHDVGEWVSFGELPFEDLLERETGGRSIKGEILFRESWSKARFCRAVEQAQEWIASGDIYQVNLAHRFQADASNEPDPFALYLRLREASPSPYCAYLNLGGRQVLSSSPECFLKMSGSWIRTRPIKGTRPRFADRLADEKSAYDLMTSPKEIAELVMITDLERNDLGRICEFGSIQVAELLKLERYAQVFHLVSTVEGRLRPGINHVDALTCCMPGGSISGAPKMRALEIIRALEPVNRGLYTGAIGYFGWNGESQFNIAIRTLVREGKRWHFHVGAGIVADSQPEAEYEETLHKAAGIFQACRGPGTER